MNKIILAGRLTRDIELRVTNTGTEVANFSIAVDRRIKKGEEKVADFINCTAWGKTGVFVNQYFHRGDGITLDGRLEMRKYADKDGVNRTVYDVICENVEFPLGKGKAADSTQDFTELPPSEDDLPF